MSNHAPKVDPIAKIVFLLVLLAIVAVVYVLVSNLVSTYKRNSTKGEIDSSQRVAIVEDNLKPVGISSTSDAPAVAAPAAARSGNEVYKAVCAACHATGVAGSPKVGDKAAWEPRVATGLDALMNTAVNGKGAMPARGGQNVGDAELKAAILYMTKETGFDLGGTAEAPKKEVVAPAPAPKEEAPKKEEMVAAPKAEDSKKEEEMAPAPKAEAPMKESAPVAEEAPKAEASAEMTSSAPAAPANSAPANDSAPANNSAPKAPAMPAEPAVAVAPVAAAEPTAPAASPEPTASAEPSASSEPSASNNNEEGKKVYNATCFACHATGVAGSPKLGDKEAWAPRIATGMDALYHTALNGKGAMPPKGGNVALADEKVKAAVDYMINAVK